MIYSPDIIDQVRDQVDLVELVRESVPGLQRSGRNWKALCPFHQEKTPSFMVSQDKNIFYCFGCSKGGDAFKFLMLMENMGFGEAVEELAKRYHVGLPNPAQRSVSTGDKQRQALIAALAFAAEFYEKNLWDSSASRSARAYLEHRGFHPDILRRFHVGAAPADGKSLLQAALRKGFSVHSLEKAGLAAYSQKSQQYHDYFWNRVMFPIIDAKGQVVAFGGRIIEEGHPKYLNSPETPVYSKSRHLFGLLQAAPSLRAGTAALIMEGYMDVLTAHAQGICHAVAPLGTSLTAEQVRLIKRYCQEVALVYDGDDAGAEASVRGALTVLEKDLVVRLVRLPGNLDPDDYIRKHGTDDFLRLVDSGQDLIEFCLGRFGGNAADLSLEQRIKQAQYALDLVAKVPNEIQRSEWVKLIAQRLSLDPDALARQMKKRKGLLAKQEEPSAPFRPVVRPIEEEILQMLIQYPELKEHLRHHPIAFNDSRCQQVMTIWDAQEEGSQPAGFQKVLGRLDRQTAEWLSALALEERYFQNPVIVFEGLLDSHHRRFQEHRRRQLEKIVHQMLEGMLPRDDKKIEEFQEITKNLKGSKIA